MCQTTLVLKRKGCCLMKMIIMDWWRRLVSGEKGVVFAWLKKKDCGVGGEWLRRDNFVFGVFLFSILFMNED